MDKNNIKTILFTILRNNYVEISDTKEVGKIVDFNVMNGSITLMIANTESILTNIRGCRVIFNPEDIPLHLNIYREEQVSDFGRNALPGEIENLQLKGVQ